jgi:hypothetical protein
MESHRLEGRIHLSQSTPDEYFAADKGHCLVSREDRVVAKGIGEIQTYWLINPGGVTGQSCYSPADGIEPGKGLQVDHGRSDSLIQWNIDYFSHLLKQIVASRVKSAENESSSITSCTSLFTEGSTSLPLEEVKEVIDLPPWEGRNNSQSVETSELDMYIAFIAKMYADHPFHNFDHASHVIMSVVKLMSRFESPGIANGGSRSQLEGDGFSNSFLSDPLTRFACAFLALIHDVQHPGAPNEQFIREDPELAERYK